MSRPAPGPGATRAETLPPAPENATTAQLLGRLSEADVAAVKGGVPR
jgi:hypothetical protein